MAETVALTMGELDRLQVPPNASTIARLSPRHHSDEFQSSEVVYAGIEHPTRPRSAPAGTLQRRLRDVIWGREVAGDGRRRGGQQPDQRVASIRLYRFAE